MRHRILYLGDLTPGTTSVHRLRALERIGHQVTALSVEARIRSANIWLQRFHYRTGYFWHAKGITRHVLQQTRGQRFDVCWVDGGSTVNAGLLQRLRGQVDKIVNYNTDDPPGGRDGSRWRTFLRALDDYDLLVVPREPTATDLRRRTRTSVMRVYFSYDPVAHAPISMSAEESRDFASKVVFVGAWKPERGPFLRRLLDLGVPITLYGNGWQGDPHWSRLQGHWRPAVAERSYVAAIQAADVALGLLSAGNRDEHTQRSLEIPFIGTAFCAQRTGEHAAMFADGVQALLWSTPEECAEKCRMLLDDPSRRTAIAAAARRRVVELAVSNDEVMAKVLQTMDRTARKGAGV